MKDKLTRLLAAALIIFFLSPIFIILFYFKIKFELPIQDLFFAVKNSFFQSVVTACICILAALALVPGLAKAKVPWINIVLLPAILPSIFTALIVFSFFKSFPFGHAGIILIFFVTYFGMATLILLNAFLVAAQKYQHLIQIYNISRVDRYLKIYLPELKRDILNVFLIIILGCFSSLSVPLLAGGGRSANVEILIYESVILNGQWGTAALVALCQMSFMFALGFILHQNSFFMANQLKTNTAEKIKINFSVMVLGFYIFLYVFGYLFQVARSVVKVRLDDLYFADFFRALSHSALLAVVVIGIFLFLTVSLFYLDYLKVKSYFLMYFLLPSSTVVGFAGYLLFPENAGVFVDILKVAFGLNIIYCLALYKSYIYPRWRTLQTQLEVSQVFGISFHEALRIIILPQINSALVLSATILVIFSFCEFALVKAAGTQTLLAGVFIERLISTYRLDLGFIYSFIVLVLVLSFFSLLRVFYVKNK